MEIRVKSIISSIHKYRDQYKTNLDKTKEELKKLKLLIDIINWILNYSFKINNEIFKIFKTFKIY